MIRPWRNLIFVLVVSVLASFTNALAISYCSSENTAGDFQAIYSQYQSNGLCQNSCAAYAYAVLQGAYCWCSDYAPAGAGQQNTLDCNQQCPGYGSDWCGSTSAGLYGYYALGVPPSGTAGAAPSASSVSASPSTLGFYPPLYSIVSAPSVQSSTSKVPSSSASIAPVSSISMASISTFSTYPLSTSSSFTSLPAPTQSTPKPSSDPTQAYTSVTTVTGEVKTIIITPTATADPTLGQGVSSSGGVSKGKVVGIVLGVALGLGLLIGLAVWFWLRRKHAQSSRPSSETSGYPADSGDSTTITPSRQMSQMSSSGLLGKSPRIQTSGFGPSNNPKSAETSSSGFDRRSLGTDQRLNPMALYAHEESRLSSVSLQDNQDYSRQLRVANPDP